MSEPATDASPPPPGAPQPPPPQEILCPACGYDLRGAPTDRCSECGVVLDRSLLGRSGFPWVYRETTGRFWAFLKTVWLVTIDSAALRFEQAKRQSPADAAVFRRWVSLLLAVALAGAATAITLGGGLEDLVVEKPTPFGLGRVAPLPGYAQDLLVPWSAGIALPGAAYAYAVLLAAYIPGAAESVFRTRGMSPDRQESTRAIARYTSAPLAWVLPGTLGNVLLFWADHGPQGNSLPTPLVVFINATFLLVWLGMGLTVFRTGQWKARVTREGYLMGFGAMAELLVRWAVGGAVLLCVVPWCAGFLWLVLDSFRL